MKLAICTLSPPGYVHSEAFRELAQTLHAAAGALGHEPSFTGRCDLDQPTIVLGSNLLPLHPQPIGTNAVLYNLEQAGEGPWLKPAALELFRQHPVWDFSEHNATNLAAMGVPRPRVVPIGWMPELARIPAAQEEIDVLFYGSLNARRMAVLEELRKAGAQVVSVVGVYGDERDALIARSRIVLNVHYFEAKVFEMVRIAWLLGNGRCVVSERGAAPGEEAAFEEGIAFAAYDDLVRACMHLLERPAERARLAAAGRRIMEARPETLFLGPALASW